MNPLRIVPVTLTLSAAAAAQGVSITPLPTRGMMPSFPAGVMMPQIPNEILKKAPGLPTNGAPSVLTGFNSSPNYSVLAILAAMPGVPSIEIDAMSSGNDALPLIYDPATGLQDDEFRIYQGNSGWAVLYLAMRNMAVGEPGGPEVPDAVMGYYFDNPAFPGQLQSVMYYELLPSDFYPLADIPSSLDIAMGLLDDGHERLEASGSNPITETVFFSLTNDSAIALDALQLPPLRHILNQPYSGYTGATIFAFGDFGNGNEVVVYETRESLGLEEGDDIDALAIARPQAVTGQPSPFLSLVSPLPTSMQYVISLVTTDREKELLAVAEVATPQGPNPHERRLGPVRGNDGRKLISGDAGSLDGELFGACSQCPDDASRGGSSYGGPVPGGIEARQPVLSLSLALETTAFSGPADNFMLTGVVSGWAGEQPQDSWVYLSMQMVGGHFNNFQFTLGPWLRLANNDYLVFQQPFPAVPWMESLSGIPTDPWVMNRCRFHVVQLGITQLQADPPESFRSGVWRMKQ